MIVLSHMSALQAMMRVREKDAVFGIDSVGAARIFEQKRVSLPASQKCIVRMEEIESIRNRYGVSEPVNLHDPSRGRRQWNERVHFRSSTHVPKKSFLMLESGVYACSPEFALAQVALELETVELVRLISDLCSRFLVRKGRDELLTCERLTDIEAIRRFVQLAPRLRGSLPLSGAVDFAVENSASPRETETALRLSLPYRMGGYGLPKPSLNAEIELDEIAARIAGKRKLRCDLYWPSKRIAVEYDSDSFHVGAERIAMDSVRRDALLHMGISVVTITNAQLKSISSMDAVAFSLSKQLGKRIRCKRTDYYERKQRLARILRSRPSWG